jgi:hypothetical protein
MTQAEVARELVTRFYHRLWNEWDDTAVDDTLSADGAGATEGAGKGRYQATEGTPR